MGVPSGPPQVVVPGAGWVDVAARVITTVGFPVVVAAALLWFVLTRFEGNMDTITARMERNADMLGQFVDELQAQTVELQAQTGFLRDQSAVMAHIERDSAALVELRRQEVEERRRGAPK